MEPILNYPEVRRDDEVQDDIHGTIIKDPYRWLEDPDSEETRKFVTDQNALTQQFVENKNEKEIFVESLKKYWNYPRQTCPMRHSDKYYFYKNSGLQNQNVLYTQDDLKSEATVFLDPNELSDDGTVAMAGTRFSDNGELMAYGLSEKGSDWVVVKVKDARTGENLDDVLYHMKFFSVAWTLDNKGFFYTKYPVDTDKADGSETLANENQKLYYHRIGEKQDKDVLIIDFEEQPTWRLSPEVSHCGRYLILYIMQGCKGMRVYFTSIEGNNLDGRLSFTKLIDNFDYDFDYITNVDSVFTFRTNRNAGNFHIVNVDLSAAEGDYKWNVLVKEHSKNVMDWCHCVDKDKIVAAYIVDVKSALQVFSLKDGSVVQDFQLPVGTIQGFSGDRKYSEIFYHIVSFLTPGTIYRFDFVDTSRPPTVHWRTELQDFKPDLYHVEQVFYESRDAERIPMFLIEKKVEKTREPKPCLLYGYGGFNISLQPSFSVTGLVFIDAFDGILAYPNIRGGGEYGERWHNSGRLLNKQNSFNDFQDAAAYLTKNGYTEAEKIGIQGASNGGLLVGACINQAPHLFGAAVIQVGVLDMLRFHMFTIGKAWVSDFGDISEKKHFDNLLKVSPLHNVRTPASIAEQYPATMVVTADHDDRVSPLHSYKFAAALQHAVRNCPSQKNPVLLRVYEKAGHGAGKPTLKRIEEAADVLSFLYKFLKLKLRK